MRRQASLVLVIILALSAAAMAAEPATPVQPARAAPVTATASVTVTGPMVIQGEGGAAVGAVSTGTAEASGTVNLSPKTSPMEVRRRQVMQILRLIQPNQHNMRVAEAALIAAGKENLPVLQELKDHPERLVGNDELTTDTYTTLEGVEFTDKRPREARVEELRKWRLQAVDGAISQFTQGYDPVLAIEKWATERGGGGVSAKAALPVKEEVLGKLFPDSAFYSLAFRMYPVAVMPPAPMKLNNVFAIDHKGAVEGLSTKEELEAWLRNHLPAVKDETAAKSAMRAWMALTQFLVTDGFYRFTLAEDSLTVEKADGGLTAAGRLDVPTGGHGSVTATMVFDADGKLKSVEQEVTLKPGIRPICQFDQTPRPRPARPPHGRGLPAGHGPRRLSVPGGPADPVRA